MKTFLVTVALGATTVSTQALAQDQGSRGGWQQDMTRQQAQQRADELFQRFDTNHDGTVTRQEAEQAASQLGGHGSRMLDRVLVPQPTPIESPPAEPDASLPPPAVVAAPPMTRTLSSPVAGARVRVDGKDQDLPATITREKGTTLTVVVSRHGYRDKTVEVAFDQEGDLAVPLERRTATSAAAKVAPPVAPEEPPKRREARGQARNHMPR